MGLRPSQTGIKSQHKMHGNGEKQHESSDEIWAPPGCAGTVQCQNGIVAPQTLQTL